MKNLLILTASVALAGSAFAAGDSNNFTATTSRRNSVPPVNNAPTVEGSIQRGVRLGSPAQMANPVAPQRYGDGHEFIAARDQNLGARERDPYKATAVGLRLFSVAF